MSDIAKTDRILTLSPHQRNLNKRKCGFDERILNLNRQVAEEVRNEAGFAEIFELEYWNQTEQ